MEVFFFFMASTLAVAFQQTQVFNSIESNYLRKSTYDRFATHVSKIATSIFDLLYLESGLYDQNTQIERDYLYMVSQEKTQSSVDFILTQYKQVREANADYFEYNEQYKNITSLKGGGDSGGLVPVQDIDLIQSVFHVCKMAIDTLSKINQSLNLSYSEESIAYILTNADRIVDVMKGKITIDDSIHAIDVHKRTSVIMLISFTLLILLMLVLAVRFIFRCYMEIQRIMELLVHMPNGELSEVKSIVEQTISALVKGEMKTITMKVGKPGSKLQVKRFIPLSVPRGRVAGLGSLLIALTTICYVLTMNNAHAFDNTLEETLTTESRLQYNLDQKIYFEQFLKDLFYNRLVGVQYMNSDNRTQVEKVFESLSEAGKRESDLLAQVEQLIDFEPDIAGQVRAILKEDMCSNPLINVITDSIFPCEQLLDNSLLNGKCYTFCHSLL